MQHYSRKTSLLIIFGLLFITLNSCKKNPEPLIGLAETKEIFVASKLPGRIEWIGVQEGDTILKGALIARLSSPEVNAKVAQADGMVQSAQARLQLARKGARPEELNMAQAALNQASEARKLAEMSFARIQRLYTDSVIPKQTFDETEFKFNAAKQNEEAAKNRLQMMQQGARNEELDGLEGMLASAKNAKIEAKSWENETAIYASTDGIIQKQYFEAGEIASAGAPIVSMIRPNKIWVLLSLREDLLKDFTLGSTVYGKIPALQKDSVAFKVVWISAMGDFATWRSTGRKGETDLRSFEIKLEPAQNIAHFLPGMSVQFSQK